MGASMAYDSSGVVAGGGVSLSAGGVASSDACASGLSAGCVAESSGPGSTVGSSVGTASPEVSGLSIVTSGVEAISSPSCAMPATGEKANIATTTSIATILWNRH